MLDTSSIPEVPISIDIKRADRLPSDRINLAHQLLREICELDSPCIEEGERLHRLFFIAKTAAFRLGAFETYIVKSGQDLYQLPLLCLSIPENERIDERGNSQIYLSYYFNMMTMMPCEIQGVMGLDFNSQAICSLVEVRKYLPYGIQALKEAILTLLAKKGIATTN